MPIVAWLDKNILVHTVKYYLAFTFICDNMDEAQGYYAKWNKPVMERQILHDSLTCRILKSLI